MKLSDSFGLQIRRDKVVQYIQAFWRGDSFFISVEYEGDETTGVPIVTSQVSFFVCLKFSVMNIDDILFHLDDRRIF